MRQRCVAASRSPSNLQVLEQLTTRTSNRSAYIERLIQEEEEDTSERLEQIQAKLTKRCRHFPPQVATTIQHIWEKRGARVVLEASEAVALVLDPACTNIP